jgi:multiple sugar transport system substrate-binding protein
MKKIVMVGFVFLICTFVLIAAGQQETETTGGGAAEEAEPVVLRFSSWNNMEGATKDIMQYMMDEYEKRYPGVKVELIGIPYEQTQQQIMVSIAGGNPPDLMHIVAQWGPPFATMGALEDLSKYYSEEEIADIPEGAYKDGLFQGELVSIPWYLAPICNWARKELLSEAGLPLEAPEKWDDFKSSTAKISGLGEGIYGFGARTSKDTNSAFWFFPVMWGHGGQFENDEGKIVFNNKGTVAALDYYKVLGTNEYAPTGIGVREIRNLFGQDKVCYMLAHPGEKGIYRTITGRGEAADDEYVVGMIPKAVDGNRYTIGNNHVFSIASQSKVKQEAVDMIKFLTQDEEIVMYYFEEKGALPSYKSLQEDPVFQNDEFIQPFIESATFASSVPSKEPNFQAALEFVAVAMQESLLGGNPSKAAADAEKNIKILYKQQ